MHDPLPRPSPTLGPMPEGSVTDCEDAVVRLRIMATSDLHMHLAPYDYYADQPCGHKGLALTAGLIAAARAEAPGALLFDNGDFLQGSPLGDFIAQEGFHPNPCMQAMTHLRYDAINLGNHEFSFGLDYLTEVLGTADLAVLSANTHRSGAAGATVPLVQPTVLIARDLTDAQGQTHRLTIGVIGVLPPQTAVWDKQAIDGDVTFSCMVQAVAQHAPLLRAQGADVVVVLAHSGVGLPCSAPMAENAALGIAAIPDVDAIVMGHLHLPFPGPETPTATGVDPVAGTLLGKPAVMPGVFGSHLGLIDLDLAKTPDGWRVASHKSHLRAIAPAQGTAPAPTADAALSALIAPSHQAAITWARRPIGRTPSPIHSYFAMLTDSIALQLVNRAQARYVSARLMGGPYDGTPLLSATAPFKAGGRAGPWNYTFIPPGNLLLRHAADLYMHPNTIVALRVTGAEVRAWLERSAQVFNHIQPGQQDQMLLNPDIASFNFDLITGVTYQIDLTAEPGSGRRILGLYWNGRPVGDNDPFILATNSYRSSGSGGFVTPDPKRVVLADQKTNRDILISYLADEAHLADEATVAPWPQAQWSFAPCPDTSVLFDSAPGSLGYHADLPHVRLDPLDLTEQGFQRYRLSL